MTDTTFNAELAELADQTDLSGLCGFRVDRRNPQHASQKAL